MRQRLPTLLLLTLLLPACEAPAPPPAATGPTPGVSAIAEVQGRGPRSPLEGQEVQVEGVVTGNFARGLGGVFIQSLEGDGDPATAEGLYLTRSPEAGPRLRPGDHVRARGQVVELGEEGASLTALDGAEVELLGRAEAQALELTAAPASAADWEALEGMLMRLPGPVTVSGNENLGRYGELLVAFGERLFAPTERALPGQDAAALAEDNARRSLRLDDARDRRDPDRIWYLPEPLSATAPLRAGSRVRGATGVLDQRHGSYRLQLTEGLDAVEQAPRPEPPAVAGEVRLAAFNLLNLFNGDGKGGGFPTARGAASSDEYRRQQAKLVATLQAMAPDAVVLLELENDGYGADSSLAQLVAALNAAGPARDWRFVDAGQGPGHDPIRVGLIYRAERLRPVGAPATVEDGPFAELSRAPLAQAFRAGDGPVFLVVANHFKSKGGCAEATGLDRDQGDGQACFNATRLASARRLHAWLAGDPTGTAPAGTVLLGDFNAYAREDPIRWLLAEGWSDAFALAGVEGPYSYVYRGQAGRLDHALLDAGLAPRLRGVAAWHANADEAEGFDYRRDDSGQPWRASDHDPLLLGLDLAR
ncbi:ExeM/NucH family extracellular endonuclease [Arenimonas fontis]|uniref:ExeM/NucH family extracellular endonuclease n=1 Tax=Arenimonas fontis TaxID=2608255 RepID=A0A5B2Z9B1_9GAMM|nr:ExeM/NucH family extracellular endonuclease [Arenimonas fontis]KAA2284103.1 ExeM/NucH family extracellular endonuclease [Arenimonas fontis]